MGDVIQFPGSEDETGYDSPIVRDWCTNPDCSAWEVRGEKLCRTHLREQEKNKLRKGPYSLEND